MTDFKVGDRVRATLGENVLVGEVAAVPVADELEVNIGEEWPRYISPGRWQVEKMAPPLPTKFGAVVRNTKTGMVYMRGNNGTTMPWVDSYHGDTWADHGVSDGGFEVIFEGVDD